MPDTREFRCFDYVNARHESVRDALQENPLGVCRAATKTAAASGTTHSAELRFGVAGHLRATLPRP